jgi:PEP-CTERM motif
MRRIWQTFAAIAVIGAAAGPIEAQWKPAESYELAGCDGLKSCHRMRFDFMGPYSIGPSRTPFWEIFFTLQGTFNTVGAYHDPCWQGCAWDVTPYTDFIGPGFNEHTKHPHGNCSIVDLHNPSSSLNRFCSGAPEFAPSFFIIPTADMNWRPEGAEVYVRYQEDGFDAPPTVVKLSLVPEPATYATMSLGLLAVAFAAHRRRRSAH